MENDHPFKSPIFCEFLGRPTQEFVAIRSGVGTSPSLLASHDTFEAAN